MGFEKMSVPEEESSKSERALKKTGGMTNWLKKQAALAGVIGATAFGSLESEAQTTITPETGSTNNNSVANVEKRTTETSSTSEKMTVSVGEAKNKLKEVLLDSSGNPSLYKGFIENARKFSVEASLADSGETKSFVPVAQEYLKLLEMFGDHVRNQHAKKVEHSNQLDSTIKKTSDTEKIGNVTLKEVLSANKDTSAYNARIDEHWLGEAQKLQSSMRKLLEKPTSVTK